MTTRRPKYTKPDDNQGAIVADLRKLGAVVWITASLGGEVLDLLVFWHGRCLPVEVKRPDHAADLTKNERWSIHSLSLVGVEAIVATCTEDVVQAFERLSSTDVYYIRGRREDEAPEM